ncbi:hypothetical protein OUZ56_006650 [Daphnia magna]|uniref:Uncharacterized protein n=1 Tax=Daphnia magna TaxID=35525 RepID=A0ABQ9YW98_9CRUS|nr:hypothetical protein OUZ56_006650 [Daphnia magna]
MIVNALPFFQQSYDWRVHPPPSEKKKKGGDMPGWCGGTESWSPSPPPRHKKKRKKRTLLR